MAEAVASERPRMCKGIHVLLWTKCLCPPFIVEALISSVAIFGDGASEEVITVKWGHKSGALTQ